MGVVVYRGARTLLLSSVYVVGYNRFPGTLAQRGNSGRIAMTHPQRWVRREHTVQAGVLEY